jgi:ribosomal protein L16 Arg81 hydroxylase
MLPELLGSQAAADAFLRRLYRKAPHSGPGTARGFAGLLTWDRLHRLVSSEPAPDMLVVREGELFKGPPPRSAAEASLLRAEGYSLVLRHTERHDEGLARLAAEAERELEGDVAIQLYATPARYNSFGWHYDAEEVFILQTVGEKEYFLRENTVNPHPRLEAMPKDMQYEKETTPTLSVKLLAGDWLYVPGGWWHVAKANEDSLSISLGVLPR